MRAFIFEEKGKLVLRETDAPVLAADKSSVLLEPVYVSPCSSDVHTVFKGNGPRRKELVLGHEGICRIIEKGSAVRGFEKNELVLVSAIMPDTEDGSTHEKGAFSGNKLGRNINGLWAEKVLVPSADTNLAHIDNRISVKANLMCTDVLPAAYTAVCSAEIKKGMTVLVMGAGAIGIAAVFFALKAGAGEVIVIGSEKRKKAVGLIKKAGAGSYYSYVDMSPVFPENAPKLPDYSCADRVIICGGANTALKTACDAVKYGHGIVVNAAYIEGNGEVGLPVFSLGRGMGGKIFKFISADGGRHLMEKMQREAYRAAESGFDFGSLVTDELHGFESIGKALYAMYEKKDDLIKIMVSTEL